MIRGNSFLVSFALPALLLPLSAQNRVFGPGWVSRSEALARRGMVATSQPLATGAAVRILQEGGTAVDGAIAANAVLCLVEPTGCGLGGDLFALVWEGKAGRLHGLNGSGRSPRSLTAAKLRELCPGGIPPRGPLPVTVPGCVAGWCALHERFGRLPLKEVLAPAIEYAREGFPVTEVIARYWEINARYLRRYPGFAETFMPGKRAPRKGEVFRNPRLAATLEKIAAGGRKAFYEGEVAEKIGKYMKEMGGYLTRADLAAHRSEWVEPVSTVYRGFRVWELPPNGQGIAVLQMLNILEAYDIAAMGFGSPDYVHLLVEAKKLVYADRARWYGDMAFTEIPVARLIAKDYAAARRRRIDPKRAALQIPAGDPRLEEGDTIYLTVADREGTMVSLIQSNYRGMGSGMTPGDLGFVLQDRGELFDLRPGRPNSYAPGKRPFHTIIPAFVTRGGKPWLSFGVMGGAMQPQGQVQVLVNLIDFRMSLQQAADAPRVRHRGSPQPTGGTMEKGGLVLLERGFPAGLAPALTALGHRVETRVGGFGGCQAILRDPESGVYYGASEYRKDGCALGY